MRCGELWILVSRKNIVFGLLLPAHDDTSIPFEPRLGCGSQAQSVDVGCETIRHIPR